MHLPYNSHYNHDVIYVAKQSLRFLLMFPDSICIIEYSKQMNSNPSNKGGLTKGAHSGIKSQWSDHIFRMSSQKYRKR